MRLAHLILLLACPLALAACGGSQLNDVSWRPENQAVIGKRFKSKDSVWAIGVSADPQKKSPDYVVLVPEPGFSGPEVVTRDRIGRGAVFKVVRVEQSRSWIAPKTVYIVEADPPRPFRAPSVRINLTGKVKDKNLGLNEANWEKVN